MGDGRRRGSTPRDSVSWRGVRTAARLIGQLLAVAALLFLSRFIARGHLDGQIDELCHLGGIAVEVLAHGVRFPLLAYAPVEHNNGSFFSALLTAVSFTVLGRNVLALKLVTHLISSAGVLAALYLLRACLDELGITRRWLRWTGIAVTLGAFALAPFLLAAEALATVGFASPAEGSAINTMLLALWASRWYARSALRMLACWLLVGIALYLSKGTMMVLPALGAATLLTSWRSPLRLAAAAAGFAIGQLSEVPQLEQRQALGWTNIVVTFERNMRAFPDAMASSLFTFSEHRIELVSIWALALVFAIAWLSWSLRRRLRQGRWPRGTPPVAVALVIGVALLHLTALAIIAQGGLDHYVVYGYPTIAVLQGVLVAGLGAQARRLWGGPTAAAIGLGAAAMLLLAHRPSLMTWRWEMPLQLWRDADGAACSWHLAEGFAREHGYGLAPPGLTREQHMIARCRSLAERDEQLDCIGGIGRDLHVKGGGKVTGEPPPQLDAAERRAFAFYYGVHRSGDPSGCNDFTDPELRAQCAAAVHLECLVFADINSQILTGRNAGQPHCELPPPPMHGYWSARRHLLLSAPDSGAPVIAQRLDDQLAACSWVLEECY